MTWSKNRGTGSLAVVAPSFDSGTKSSQFDLQDALRQDTSFDGDTRELLRELARWFEEAGHQMVAFESLKTIYASVYSIRLSEKHTQVTTPSSPRSSSHPVTPQPLVEIAKITGISGNELARYLKSITYRFNLLDLPQIDLITQDRDLLHQKLYQLTIEGVSECISSLQRAALVFEDRPQLIDFFCEQMKQVRALKDGERQLHQNIRNVDEAVRALKYYAPALASECSLQYNILHSLFSKYSSIVQSHTKFVTKVLPLITQQEEFASISTEDELERHVGNFQDIVRELHAIEDASKLYQEYQKMVGSKLVEIPMLAETIAKWEEVQQIVTLAVQWRTTVHLVENGIFSEQNWKLHTKELEAFLPQIQELQQRKELEFAACLVQNLRTSIASYLHKLVLVGELAHSYIKGHHWHQILVLLDAVSFVSNNGVLATDRSTLTLGFLRSRNFWAFESQIREIARKAQNDSVAEEKLEEMKKKGLLQAVLPLLHTGVYYEIDTTMAVQLLGSFEDDLLTIQALGQITTSDQLHTSLMNVSEAAFEFQSLDRKWKAMMNAARTTVRVECIDYDCGLLVGFDQFQRMIHGVLQSDACWLVISSLEIRGSSDNTSFNLICAIANEMNRLKDVVHARQETFPFDGELVDISNPRLGIMIAARLDFSKSAHQELMLQFSYAFVPVGCVSPELELIWETMLHAGGMKHWKALSKKLTALFLLIDNDSEPFTDVPMRSLRLVLAVAKNAVKQFAANRLKPEEKCVLVALWEEVRSKILPERRIAFLKHVRKVFPLALQLEYTSFSMLTTQVDLNESDKLNPDEGENVSSRVRTNDAGFQTSLGFDSDEEKQKNEFISVKDRLLLCIQAKHLVPSETILRKLLELYHIVSRNVVMVVVGARMCGESSAIDVVGSVFGAKGTSTAAQEESSNPISVAHRMKTVRLYPTAFHMDDIYGHFKEHGGEDWEDGFLTHFLRKNCDAMSAFQAIIPSESEQQPGAAADAIGQPVSRRLSHRGSVALTKLGKAQELEAVVACSRNAPAPWLVLDGVHDGSFLVEPLSTLTRGSPKESKKLVLPNGDQLHCENPSMRIFCEIESLRQWSPSSLSHFGLAYLEADHVLPYTLLIKSWTLKQVPQVQDAENVSQLTARYEYATKFMRSIISPVLEVCKRHSKPFMEFSVAHMVVNMLRILSLLLEEMVAPIEPQKEHECKIEIVVAYATVMSFGLSLQTKGRTEFHELLLKLVPELTKSSPGLFAKPSITIYDVGLRFENHRATLFLWEPSILQKTTDSISVDWQTRVSRRSSSIKGGSIDSNFTSAPYSSSPFGTSSANIYVLTPRTISTGTWLMMFGSTKANVFLFGDSAVGKTRMLHNCSQELTQRERFVTSTLQMSKSMTAHIRLPDQSDQIFRTILATFPTQFATRYSCDHLLSDISRISKFPHEAFKAARKSFRPSPTSPLVLFSMTDVIKHFSCMMNISAEAASAGDIVDIELLSIHFTKQIYQNRISAQSELETLTSLCSKIGKRLRFDARSLNCIDRLAEYLFTEHGDNDGYVRLTYPAALELFRADEERFHWYHKSAFKGASVIDDSTASSQPPPILASASSGKAVQQPGNKKSLSLSLGTASSACLSGAFAASVADAASTNLPSATALGYKHSEQANETQRRYSLVMAAWKSRDREEDTTASPLLVQSMLDIYALLQDGVHNLVLYGGDTSRRRSTTRVACGVHSFHFREISPQVKTSDFVDQLKTVILDTGLKSTPTLVYVDCDYLTIAEFEILVETLMLHGLPLQFYSPADKAQILGQSNRLLDLIYRYPSVYHQSGIKTFHSFDQNSLEAIYNASLGTCETLSDEFQRYSEAQGKPVEQVTADFQAAIIEVHLQTTEFQNPETWTSSSSVPDDKRRAFSSVRSQFEELLRIFKILFLFQQSKLDENIKKIEAVMHQLGKHSLQVRAQLDRELNGEVQLKDAAQAVLESGEKPREFEQMEREAKRAFLLDEQHCVVLQGEIEQERELIQQELAKTLPDLLDAMESLSQINRYHITEMKSFTSRTNCGGLVMQAVCVLLGAPPIWAEALRILADIRFLERLRNFDRDHVDPSLIERVQLYINHPDFSVENMKRASLASTTLCQRVLAIVRYFEVMKHVAPAQKKLEQTEHNFRVIDEVVQNERRKPINLEPQINELRAQHAQNLQEEDALQRSHDARVKWKSTVSEFADVLTKWRDIVCEEYRHTQILRAELVAQCILVAACIIYASGKPFDERLRLFGSRIEVTAKKNFKSTSDYEVKAGDPSNTLCKIVKNWTLSGKAMVTELKHAFLATNGPETESLVMNLFLTDQIQKVCFQYPLLFDPLQQASAWLTERFSISSSAFSLSSAALLDPPGTLTLLILDAGDPMLMATIEKQVTQKAVPLILIENVSECEEAVLNAIFELLALIKTKDENTIYFSTKPLRKPLTWTPKASAPAYALLLSLQFLTLSLVLPDLESAFLTRLFEVFADHNCPENNWKLQQKLLAAETVKRHQLVHTFLDNVHSTAASSRRGTGHSEDEGGVLRHEERRSLPGSFNNLPELDIVRITKQLDEYTVVEKKWQQCKDTLRQLSDQRTEARVFAKRLCAVTKAEERLAACDSPLHLPLPTVVETLRECVESGKSGAWRSSSESTTLGKDSFESRSDIEKTGQDHGSTAATALKSGQDPLDPSVTQNLLTADAFRGMRTNLEHGSPDAAAVHKGDDDSSVSSVTKRMAQYVVHLAVTTALVAVVDGHHGNPSAGSPHHDKLSQLDAEVRYAYWRIQRMFTRNSSLSACQVKFSVNLLENMLHQPVVWKDYLKNPPLPSTLHATSTSPISMKTSMQSFPGCRNTPEWIARSLAPLEKLLVHLCLFEFISLSQIHEFIASELGDRVVRLLSTPSGTRHSLMTIAKRAVFSTPMLLLSDPQTQVSVGLSSLLECAQKMGIRDDLLACISLGSDKSVANFRLNEFSHNNLTANVNAMSYQDMLKNLNGIKETLLSGGWMVIKDAEFGTLAAKSVLRRQIESMMHLHSNKNNDFRLWLQFEMRNLARDGRSDGEGHGDNDANKTHEFLASLPLERRFLEYPQTLLQYYAAYLQQEGERKELHQKLQQQQQLQHQQQVHQLRRPKLLSRKSSFSAGQLKVFAASDAGDTEQLWIQSALWVFHTVFRSHLETGNIESIDRQCAATLSSDGRSTLSPYPVDLLLSHFELERSMKLIQLHALQKALATTITSADNLMPTTHGAKSIASANADRDTMVEFVSTLYMGRQWSDTTTHHGISDAVVGSEASVQSRNQLILLRERLAHREMSGSTTGALPMEAKSLPYQLQCAKDSSQTISLLSALHLTLSLNQGNPNKQRCSLGIAQQSLRRIMFQFPSKTSLSNTIERQRIQRHTSIFRAYQKTTKGMPSHEIASLIAQSSSAESKELWYWALVHHLMEVELPAMETYLKYVWDMSEVVLSLNPEFHEAATSSGAFYREEANELSTTDLSLSISSLSTASTTTGEQACEGSDDAKKSTRSRESLASIVVSGLYLTNAAWSSELGVLVECTATMPASTRYQLLPPLCMHATIHFKTDTGSMLSGGGGNSRADSERSVQVQNPSTAATSSMTTTLTDGYLLTKQTIGSFTAMPPTTSVLGRILDENLHDSVSLNVSALTAPYTPTTETLVNGETKTARQHHATGSHPRDWAISYRMITD
ncbi:Dynein heavy chain, partial [Globisporangium splendens]